MGKHILKSKTLNSLEDVEVTKAKFTSFRIYLGIRIAKIESILMIFQQIYFIQLILHPGVHNRKVLHFSHDSSDIDSTVVKQK